ncbi:hypothetical protein EC973_005765 [Apophysomyces ossiformis]|uniref:Chitin-binding protein n=1 Tax=Apophysomyces ossiformis TaxID=679940 RepID=A0A8H7BK27_9FUNG|nr:hypothetical protein EC973_005765 [Apophysomyces ossiformis]
MKSSSNRIIENAWQCYGKTGFFRNLLLISTVTFLLLPIQEVSAHGALGFPLARQYGCRIDGGYYWPTDGSKIPNEGCRNAYLDAGKSYYPFQQWNEFSANPTNPNDMATVKKAVPDGLMCSGGDNRKRGVDIPQNKGWRKTVIQPKNGTFQLRWELTRSHNPAVMHIYLTKPSYDLSKPLTWADLDQVYQKPAPKPIPANGKGLISEVTAFYYLDIPIPANRSGDAIIYAYWQRNDPGHEGFYNCADVTIKQANGLKPTKQPVNDHDDKGHKPTSQWVDEKPYLQQGGGIVPKIGDKVYFRVTAGDENGQNAVNITLPITSKSVRNFKWAKHLANTLNKKYKSLVKIGVKSGNSIKYSQKNLYANQVWLKPGYNSTLTLIHGNNSTSSNPTSN